MKSAFHKQAPRYPSRWEDLPGGEAMQAAVAGACDELSQRIFGYHMLKIGNLSSQIQLPSCTVNHQISQVQKMDEKASLQSYSHILPYIENSIDGVLLANELDFAQDPHEILREVDRVITGSGFVIISGLNPYSLTGAGKFLPIKRGNILHDARFFSAARIKDWLQLLGFEIVEQRHILFSMLFFQRKNELLSLWQNWCATYCPWCASVYVILARKRSLPMTTIKPKWKLKPQFSPVSASMREQSQAD
jgi:hypothetical protein